jgi:hypothetical protein
MECPFISICSFAHERMHTHTHAHIHAHTSINQVPVCSCPFMLKHVHARTHSHTYSRTHTRTHARTHALTHKANCAVYCTSCPVYLSNSHVFGATASLLVYLYYLLFWWHFECVYAQFKNIFVFFLFKLNYNRSVHNYNICHIVLKQNSNTSRVRTHADVRQLELKSNALTTRPSARAYNLACQNTIFFRMHAYTARARGVHLRRV